MGRGGAGQLEFRKGAVSAERSAVGIRPVHDAFRCIVVGCLCDGYRAVGKAVRIVVQIIGNGRQILDAGNGDGNGFYDFIGVSVRRIEKVNVIGTRGQGRDPRVFNIIVVGALDGNGSCGVVYDVIPEVGGGICTGSGCGFIDADPAVLVSVCGNHNVLSFEITALACGKGIVGINVYGDVDGFVSRVAFILKENDFVVAFRQNLVGIAAAGIVRRALKNDALP